MNIKLMEEVKERRRHIQREIDAIDTFLLFYEQKDSSSIPYDKTIRQLCAAKMMSVRLGNTLFDYFNKEKDTISIGEINHRFGVPISEEIKTELMRIPNMGRKALNELEELLRRVNGV